MLLSNLPLVLSAFFSLTSSDAGAAAPTPASNRAPVEVGARADRGHERRDLCTQLSCTDAQRKTIEGVMSKAHERIQALHGARGEEGKALAAAMSDGKLGRDEVLAALAKNDAVREKRATIVAETMVAVYGALDPAQRKTLAQLVSERGTKVVFGGKHGGGHGRKAKAHDGKPGKPGKAKPGKAKPGKAQASASRGRAKLSRTKGHAAAVGLKTRS